MTREEIDAKRLEQRKDLEARRAELQGQRDRVATLLRSDAGRDMVDLLRKLYYDVDLYVEGDVHGTHINIGKRDLVRDLISLTEK